jgi:hypothetical protein
MDEWRELCVTTELKGNGDAAFLKKIYNLIKKYFNNKAGQMPETEGIIALCRCHGCFYCFTE